MITREVPTRAERREWKARLQEEVLRREERMVALARHLYEHPELGLAEVESAALLTQELERGGFHVTRGVAGLPTAFVARAGAHRPGPVVALLAEYDALPEIGHGCGHNLIGAAAVGAGLSLLPLLGRCPGTVLVIGCPAEEGVVDGAGGKAVLVQAGLFDKVDAALMFHPCSEASWLGGTTNAREALEVTFYGRAAHAASGGEVGVNALDAAVAAYTEWARLRDRTAGSIHAVITEGGRSPNVIPERARLRLYVRESDSRRLDALLERVRGVATEAARSVGARYEIRRTAHRYESLITNRPLAEAFAKNLRALGEPLDDRPLHNNGSTDMGNVSRVVPAIHPFIAISRRPIATHTREFAAATISTGGRRGLRLAAQALAATAFDLLVDPDLQRAVAAEHRRLTR